MAGNRALWADIRRDLAGARNSSALAAERAASLAERGPEMAPDIRFDRELAVGTLLHDCYCAMEAAMERLVEAVDGDRPAGGDYHAQLIRPAEIAIEGLRPAMISATTAKDLQALRSFRHTMCHGYGSFEYARALPNVAIALRGVDSFTNEITAFCKIIAILCDSPGEGRET